MNNGNSADPRILAEDWHHEFVNKFGYPPDAEDGYAAGYREALSVCADGGKGEAVEINFTQYEAFDEAERQVRKEMEMSVFQKLMSPAPQAECAPHADAEKDELIDRMDWCIKWAAMGETTTQVMVDARAILAATKGK